jgi:Na+/H+ antiporter NhaD/arsenite permease-like protein
MDFATIFAAAIFLIAFFFIASEKVHKTIVAILAIFVLSCGKIFLNSEKTQLAEILSFVDFDVLGIIIGLMIVVRFLEKSGVFTALAMKIVLWEHGNMKMIFASLMFLAAILSFFLSNVATVMILTPVFLVISMRFKIDPRPFFFTEILVVNFAGIATPIADVANMIISSRAGFSFSKIFLNLAGFSIFAVAVAIFLAIAIFRKKLCSPPPEDLADLKKENWIEDSDLARKSFAVLILILIGFFTHDFLQIENGLIALSGAMFLILIAKKSPQSAFELVEWPIVFFFFGLFALVGSLEKVGIIEHFATSLATFFDGNFVALIFAILFGAAIFSAFVDNIPFATAMIPVIFSIGAKSAIPIEPLFFALILGCCFGGAGTLVGASPNLIIAGIAEQNDAPISFGQYFKFAFPIMIFGVLLAAIFLFLFQI